MDYSNLFILNGLESSDAEKIIKSFPPVQNFKKGEIIYSSTDFNKAIGFVKKGTAIAVSNNQNHVFLAQFKENMCFGAAAIFGEADNYVSTITAKTDSEILFLREDFLKKLFAEYPKTAINYISFLSDKIRFLNNKLCVISCMSAEDTVLTYLINSKNSENYADIPKSMTTFAKMLGLSRASLYRALDNLQQNGSILKENNKYKVIKNEKTN